MQIFFMSRNFNLDIKKDTGGSVVDQSCLFGVVQWANPEKTLI